MRAARRDGHWENAYLQALVVSRSALLSFQSSLMSLLRCNLASMYAAAAVVPAATAAVVAAMELTY